ncbi:MAG: competence damage-inducible protein A [Thermoprotei archaeon]|nr:MAG: competence damage-inducible protein A [Thermoprotei archaeon]
MAEQLVVEVISVGNELLTGRVVNTNASWIADRVTRLGGVVKRVTAVGDDITDSSRVIAEALARRPKLIVLTGGLGPTFDDRTLESLSVAVGVPLEVNLEALRMVEEKYGGEVTPPRFKMARLPRGSKPLYNPLGTAPGAMLDVDGTIVVALPGVPSEMKAMFELHVEPLLAQLVKEAAYTFRVVRIKGLEESSLAPIIDEVMRLHRAVYVKSHPKREPEMYLEVEVSCRASSLSEAESHVQEACETLKKLASQAGAQAEDTSTR